MKKLNLSILLFAILMTGSLVTAQQKKQMDIRATEASSIGEKRISLKSSTVARLYTTIAFLETIPNYRKGMSKEEFLADCFGGVPDFPASKIFRGYLGVIFQYHNDGLTPNQVYSMEGGGNFETFHDETFKLYKKGASIEANMTNLTGVRSWSKPTPDNPLSCIMEEGKRNPEAKIRPKNGWLNLIRKLADLLDNEFPGL